MKTNDYKMSHFSILTSQYSLLLTFGFWLLAFSLQAQNYEWSWAKNGGGNLPISNEGIGVVAGNNYSIEHIRDIVVDEDNNYYFVGKISHGNSHVDSNAVTTFGSTTTGSHNIFITSFTCNGTYRWSRIIGGGGVTSGRYALNLVLDNNGGIYISVNLGANTTGANNEPPICFGENNCLPYLTGDNYTIQEGRKAGFLLKYDTDNGDLLWRKNYEGDVNYYTNGTLVSHLQIDSNNVLHTIIGLRNGVHLDGALTVTLDEDEDRKYYLVKFNSTTGALIGTPLLLPLETKADFGNHINNTSFRYDENLNRYYLAGWVFGSPNNTVSFNGVTLSSGNNNDYAYLLSFNPDNLQDWWYKEFIGAGSPRIQGVAIDDNSDIYIGGCYFLSGGSSNTVYFGDYAFSSSGSVTGNRPYILKMNSQGVVQWSKMPTGYLNPENNYALYYAFDVAVNGNEVALATHGSSTIWDSYSMNRPSGHAHDPYLIRFNKQTGQVIGLHDIYGGGGYDILTAVTADQDGNYVVGGAMLGSMFTNNPNGIPTLYNTGNQHTDFFMARLAKSACGTSSNEVFEQPQVRLYPNPTNGLVYIETQENIQSYEVYNLLGQKVLEGDFNDSNLPSFGGVGGGFNMQELSNGTYIVKIRTQSGEVITEKVIKNR